MREKWKQSAAYEKLQKLKKDMEPMSFWEKIDHLWYCYKLYIIVVAAITVMLGGVLVSTISYQSKDRLVSGMLVNVSIDQLGMNYLTSEYKQYLNGAKNEVVELESIYFGKLTETSHEDDYSSMLALLARVDGKLLDYMLLDKDGMETGIAYDIFLDLREFFTEEEIQQLEAEDRLIFAMVKGEEERWPLAVKITDIPFVKDNVNNQGEIYFGLGGREPNLEVCRNVWEYLNAWESK